LNTGEQFAPTAQNLAFLGAIASVSTPHVLEYIWISPIDIYYNSRKTLSINGYTH